jgi:TolA-binding protein
VPDMAKWLQSLNGLIATLGLVAGALFFLFYHSRRGKNDLDASVISSLKALNDSQAERITGMEEREKELVEDLAALRGEIEQMRQEERTLMRERLREQRRAERAEAQLRERP